MSSKLHQRHARLNHRTVICLVFFFTSPVSGVEGLTCFIDFAFLDGFGCALVLSQENRSGFFPAVILVDLRVDVILSKYLSRSKFG